MITYPALARTERDRLAELEAVVDAGAGAFLAVGRALLEIRDKRLYRDGYANFQDYLSTRWNMGRSWAYKLIADVNVSNVPKVSQNLSSQRTNGDTHKSSSSAEVIQPGSRIQELLAKGLNGLTPDDQLALVQASEEEVLDEVLDEPGRKAAQAFRRSTAAPTADLKSRDAALERWGDSGRSKIDERECDRALAHKLLTKLLVVMRGTAR